MILMILIVEVGDMLKKKLTDAVIVVVVVIISEHVEKDQRVKNIIDLIIIY